MADLAAFLTARYDEAEALARAMPLDAQHPWDQSENLVGTLQWVSVCAVEPNARGIRLDLGRIKDRDVAAFIVANHPRRVLADIAAKRSIVALYRDLREWRLKVGHDETAESWGARTKLDFVCQLLAASFASHPDFDPAWRTDG